MDKLIPLQSNCLNILLAPRRMERGAVNLLIAGLAVKGLVYILDGGNCFDGYGLARRLRSLSEQAEAILRRVRVARAFTCHQMTALLSQQADAPISLVILEMLDTFRDENIPEEERLRLLGICLVEVERLSRKAMVLAAISRPKADPGHLARLLQIAERRFEFEEPLEEKPLRLF